MHRLEPAFRRERRWIWQSQGKAKIPNEREVRFRAAVWFHYHRIFPSHVSTGITPLTMRMTPGRTTRDVGRDGAAAEAVPVEREGVAGARAVDLRCVHFPLAALFSHLNPLPPSHPSPSPHTPLHSTPRSIPCCHLCRCRFQPRADSQSRVPVAVPAPVPLPVPVNIHACAFQCLCPCLSMPVPVSFNARACQVRAGGAWIRLWWNTSDSIS